MIFGGNTGVFTNETWEYDGSSFVMGPAAPVGLAPRVWHSSAYDSGRGLVVVFGGTPDGATALNDTWEYDGVSWTSGPAAPMGLTPRVMAAAAYDEGRGVIVLHGGATVTSILDETWEYDGTAWTAGPAAPLGMVPRAFPSMVYDSVRSVMVMFGGMDDFGPPTTTLAETWEYDGTAWSSGPSAPVGLTSRFGASMAFDPSRNRTVLYGGSPDDIGVLGDTWEYDSTSWTPGAVSPTAMPARGGVIGDYDANRKRFVFFGGFDGTNCYDETWEYGDDSNFVVGEGLGQPNANTVQIHLRDGTPTAVSFLAYGAGRWGVNVASGNTTGEPESQIVTGPGPGDVFGPQVRAFRPDGLAVAKINFFAYGTLKFGVNPGSALLDLDNFHEMLTGAGPGAVFGPHARGWNFDNTVLTAVQKVNYFAYATLKFGVNVADGDLDGDTFAEMLTGAGPGAIFAPTVRGFNFDATTVSSMGKINFNAYPTPQYGVNLAGGDVDRDGFAEIATAPGPGDTASFPSQFLGFNFDAATLAGLPGFDVTTFTATLYGGRVGLGDVSSNFSEDLLAGAGRDPSADSTVESYRYDGAALTLLPNSFMPFGSLYGVNVTEGALGH